MQSRLLDAAARASPGRLRWWPATFRTSERSSSHSCGRAIARWS